MSDAQADVSAEAVAVDILNGLNVYRTQPNIDSVVKRIIAHRRAGVEACRKAICEDCRNGVDLNNGLHGRWKGGCMGAVPDGVVLCKAQALAGVGEEK